MSKVFEYILKFKGDTKGVDESTGGLKASLKGAALAAGALFSVAAVAAAGKAVFEYAQQISAVRGEVEKLTGLTGAGLNAVTGAAQAIAATFNTEVSQVLISANTLSKQFGISMTESLDMVKKGLASGANINGDFLDQVKEYAPHFKAAGLEVSQMVAVMSNSGKQGIFSDKGADVIKEAGLRLREMTASTTDALRGIGINSDQMQRDLAQGNITIFSAMQQVSNRLAEFPAQSAKVGTAIADIFGGPGEDAGLEYIKMLGHMDLSIDGIMSGMSDAGKAQMKWADAQTKFHTIGATVFGGTGEMIMKVKTALLNMVNGAITGIVSLANYFIDLYNESNLFRGLIQLIGANIKEVFTIGRLILGEFMDRLKRAGQLMKAVFTLDFKGVKEALKGGLADTIENFKEFGRESAKNYTKALQNTINPREKIKAITINKDDAVQAGVQAGQDFAKGLKSGMSLSALGLDRSSKMQKMTPGALPQLDVTDPTKSLVGSSIAPLNENNQLMAMLIEKHQKYSEAVASSAQSISGVFSSIGEAIGGAAGSWISFAGRILSQIPQIISQITTLTNAQLASSMTITAGKQTEAAGSAAASAASLPFPANIAGMIAAVASVITLFASFKSAPKMAKGGVFTGPSFVQVGEYPGVQSNPEVISPLNTLKKIFAGNGEGQNISFERLQISYAGLDIGVRRGQKMRNRIT